MRAHTHAGNWWPTIFKKGSNYFECFIVYCWYEILCLLYIFNPSRLAVSAVLLIWCTIKYCRIPFIHLPLFLLCFFAKNYNNRLQKWAIRIEINESKTDYNAYLVKMKKRKRKGSSVSCIYALLLLLFLALTHAHTHKQSSFAHRMKSRKVKI